MPILITAVQQGNDVRIDATLQLNLNSFTYGFFNNVTVPYNSIQVFQPLSRTIFFRQLGGNVTVDQYVIPQSFRLGNSTINFPPNLVNYTLPRDFPPTFHVCFTDANFRWQMPPPPILLLSRGCAQGPENLPPFSARRGVPDMQVKLKVPGVSTSSDQRE